MHTNVYSDEGGITTIECGRKKAKDGTRYPYIGVYFKNGNAIKFFGKTVAEVQVVVDKINEAMTALKTLPESTTNRTAFGIETTNPEAYVPGGYRGKD